VEGQSGEPCELVIDDELAHVEGLTKRAHAITERSPQHDLAELIAQALDRTRAAVGAIITRGASVLLAHTQLSRAARPIVWPMIVPASIVRASMTEGVIVTCRAWSRIDAGAHPEAMFVVPLRSDAVLWIASWDPLTTNEAAELVHHAAEIAGALNALEPWSLVVRYDAGERIEKLRDDPTTIGRHADNTIVLASPTASRHHAVIRRAGDRWVLADAGSASGMYVNGERLRGERLLSNGDRIRIGHADIEVVGPARGFLVAIEYREPTYAASTEGAPKIYRGSFDVDAEDEDEARERALDEFRRIQRLSSVGWAREVVSVTVVRSER
jgi:hypothetical protein